MARAVYQHELQDPDFSWLINRFQELNPQFLLLESNVQPLVFIRRDVTAAAVEEESTIPAVSQAASDVPYDKRD